MMLIKPEQIFTRSFALKLLKSLQIVEAVLLFAIAMATLVAIFQEFRHLVTTGAVHLSDILLMFLYLEVLAMIQQYITNGKIPVRYPIYIAIIAIARYITLAMKEISGETVVWLALATLLLAAATLIIRIGHNLWPYKNSLSLDQPDKAKDE